MMSDLDDGGGGRFRAAAVLAGFLGAEIYADPTLVLSGLAVVNERVRALEVKLRGRSPDLRELEQIAVEGRFGIAEPLRRIREVATAIREGRTYNPLGLGAAFSAIDYTCRELEGAVNRDGRS